ncbi:spermatogenesis-associated protein 16-like [Megalops cyprinoides]|uniref:spermatogenesis-associated protein 16-like n=1 Tax=Megalops cyprinoides TaxID=118141 RepID=UPI0018655137|nr:spermatogenesis-associated protein 16-like [Megalops cyprinoides]
MGPKKEKPKDDSQSLHGGGVKTKRKRRNSGTRPKWRNTEHTGMKERSVEEKQVNLGWEKEASPVPMLPRIPLKSIMEVEMKLVYSDEQDIAQKLTESPASSASQLMCQASEIVGPPSGPNLSFLPQIDKWLDVALQDADSYYRRKKYGVAASRFTTALELCSKGAVLSKAFDADYEDISKVASFIESKLVACYLRMRRPDLALNHSHRSIHLNPIHFQNHFRQAVVYRLLGHPREAARSAMIADYVYWLSGGTEQHISKLIKLYWQAMLEEAITMEDNFSVMYTPCNGSLSKDGIQKTKEIFQRQHPVYTQYLFTDASGSHFLPQTTSWTGSASQRYTLTLGFRRSEDGNFLDQLLTRKCPIFTGSRTPFNPLSTEDIERMSDNLERKILPVLDFLKCTKLAVGFSAGSGLMERLQYADCLGQLRRAKEQSVAVHQTLAELAVAPYLQDISHSETQMLQALMADSMDTLEGRRTDKERVWNEMQKIGLLEDLVYQLEEKYLKDRGLKDTRKPKAREKRGRKRKAAPSLEERLAATNQGTVAAKTFIHSRHDNWDSKGLSSN